MRETISISLPGDLKEELDEAIRVGGGSRSDLVREALREFLFHRRLRALRHELMPHAESQGIFTDEDVFRIVS